MRRNMTIETGSILLSEERGITSVVLNRPPVNAVDATTYDELRRVFEHIAQSETCRAVILRGEGRVFCGGNELRDFIGISENDAAACMKQAAAAYSAIYRCPIPIIGAINGGAMGTGMILASLCDIRIAASRAFFGIPEINVGFAGGARHVLRLAGEGMTRWMAYTGRRVSAEEALQRRMVEQVVSEDELLAAANALANEIADKSRAAIRLIKRGINGYELTTLERGFEDECALIVASLQTPEALDGAQAFLEKRRPSYSNR